MIFAAWVQTAVLLLVLGLVLFWPAGRWGWAQAWIFLAEIGAGSMAVSLWLARHDPALLAARLSGPVHAGQARWDRVFFALAGIWFLAWLALCGWDAGRRGGSAVPVFLQIAGGGLIGLSLFAAWLTFRVNSYAAPQVRVQADRGQTVVTSGPYRIVRHPMYAGAVLFFVGTPLLLGSWWGLLPVPVGVVGLGIRAVGEERMLRQALVGYEAYAARVRFRLVPGIW